MSGTLFVVATPIGNLEDLSARAARILRDVRLIAAEDTRRTAQLLARYGIATPTTSLREHNEARKTPLILARLGAGDNIALVSDAGTPTVSDPGTRLVAAARDGGYRVEPVAGPSAVLAALSVSGFPADVFMFLGFPPIRSKDRKLWFERLSHAGCTTVFFEAPHRIRRTLQELEGLIGDRPVLVARELTKLHEESVVCPISEALQRLARPVGEFTVVVRIGQITNIVRSQSSPTPRLAAEFAQLTENEGFGRRAAVRHLARAHGLPQREVYAALERAKRSAE